jgi:hydroxyethylthiazole kinase
VTDGSALWRISNGVPGLQDITASGCSVTAMIAAFVAAAGKERAGLAAAAALAVFG